MPLKEGIFSFSSFSSLHQLVQSFLSVILSSAGFFKLGDEIKDTLPRGTASQAPSQRNRQPNVTSQQKVCKLEKRIYTTRAIKHY